MTLTIDCKNLKGNITVPYSKSMAHRYLIANFLASNYDAINNFDEKNISLDVLSTKECLQELISDNRPAKLNCRESGTTLRFIISIVAALGIESEITVSGTLISRPMTELVEELRRHGSNIEIERKEDFKVYKISGKISSGNYSLPGNVSSQYISSLLFALPLLEGKSIIQIDGEIESKPYIDLTLETLEKFGIKIEVSGNSYAVSPNQRYTSPSNALEIIEGDWSQGAIFLSANSILNTISVNGLNPDSLQADAFIQDLLEIEDDLDVIISANDCPDLVPSISLWALNRNGETVITDLARLKLKESNRLDALCKIINKLGGKAQVQDDNLIIKGSKGKLLKSTNDVINCYNDHRLVMFSSLASIITDKPVTIDTPDAVKKSYPNFFADIESLGGVLKWN